MCHHRDVKWAHILGNIGRYHPILGLLITPILGDIVVINRPGVVGAVLYTALSFIHSLINSLTYGLWEYFQDMLTSLHPNHKC